jgi:hypothetical protein
VASRQVSRLRSSADSARTRRRRDRSGTPRSIGHGLLDGVGLAAVGLDDVVVEVGFCVGATDPVDGEPDGTLGDVGGEDGDPLDPGLPCDVCGALGVRLAR